MTLAANEMLFLIPFSASPLFERAFSAIERIKGGYGIRSWALAVCNLEEVFLKVASTGSESDQVKPIENHESANESHSDNVVGDGSRYSSRVRSTSGMDAT